ncbi:MAG: hypothetical protein HUJ29_06245 [Gammaproteobacteria bacterium]|nr:hypothetical protein [Gammaproteobacteria bacterium]
MHEETTQLIEAVRSLKSVSDPLKDYIVPFATAFFSALLGAFVAYLTIAHQDKVRQEQYKVRTANNWLLKAEGAMQSLIALKHNYHGKLTANPYQRTLTTRAFIHNTKALEIDISELSFIVPKKGDTEALDDKWRSIGRIRAILHNYNFVISLWDKRAEAGRPLVEKIVSKTTGVRSCVLTFLTYSRNTKSKT